MNPLNYEKNLLSCSAWARRAVCARAHRPPAGLLPGESITLSPYLYHSFWGTGSRVLVGEVSAVNDDQEDNRFHQPLGRFPDIVEDEPPLYLLVNDYADYYRP